MNLTLQQRIEAYQQAFPKFQPLYLANERRIEGLWIMGNDYSTSGYHGAYPHGYLKRVSSMFPDAKDILHAPSGSLPPGDYLRIDGNPDCKPDIVGDIHDIKELVGNRLFDLSFIDVPYSKSDADHYGFPMVRRNVVLRSVLEVTRPGGFIVWLDQVHPQHRKVVSPEVGVIYLREEFPELSDAGEIGMVKSTNHRVRGVFMFQRV